MKESHGNKVKGNVVAVKATEGALSQIQCQEITEKASNLRRSEFYQQFREENTSLTRMTSSFLSYNDIFC